MSEFKTSAGPGDGHETKATARLPGLDIDIVHRRSPSGDSEQIAITLQAAPSFEAFGRFLERMNPLAFWAEAWRLAYLPWIDASRLAMLPWTGPARIEENSDSPPFPKDRRA